MKKPNTASPYYVDNERLSQEVIAYRDSLALLEDGEDPPRISEYIGESISRICKGLASKPNFRGYGFKNEMISDAVFSCLKAIKNFDETKATRRGVPNAHGYFTQCAYWAMVQKIKQEQKEADKMLDLVTSSGIIEHMITPGDEESERAIFGHIESLRVETEKFQMARNNSKGKHYGWGKSPGTLTQEGLEKDSE